MEALIKIIKKIQNILYRGYKKADKFVLNDPFRAVVILGCIVGVLSVGGYSYKERSKELAQVGEVLGLPIGSVQQIDQWAKQGKIEIIKHHNLNGGGFWLSQPQRWVEFVERKEGSPKALERERFAIPWSLYDNDELKKRLIESGFEYNIEYQEGYNHTGSNSLSGAVRFGLIIMFLVFLILIAQRAFMDVLVGKNFHPGFGNENLNFDDIVGYESVKKEFRSIFLHRKYKSWFSQQGMNPPKGLLLTGAPGVGKTMFAKALANEMRAQFLYATGADFVELYVGTGARRVRSLFAQARLEKNTVIFIDEIDALGSRSGHGMDSERLATINQLLAEMDGFNELQNILVIGATNYVNNLDAALLRPGRFDKIINIPLPDVQTREGILKYYLGKIKNDANLDPKQLALNASGMSGAELKNWVNEAKHLAFERWVSKHPEFNAQEISSFEELEKNSEAYMELVLGTEDFQKAQEELLLGKHAMKPNDEDLECIAVHELGHAFMFRRLLSHLQRVEKVAVGGKGNALGLTFCVPLKESLLHEKQDLLNRLVCMLGGRAAEEVFFKTVTTGSADDLQKATALAVQAVTQYGWGEKTGLLAFKMDAQVDLKQLPDSVQQDVQKLLGSAYEKALRLVRSHVEWFEQGKEILRQEHVIDAQRFESLYQEFGLPKALEIVPLSAEEEGVERELEQELERRRSHGKNCWIKDDTPGAA